MNACRKWRCSGVGSRAKGLMLTSRWSQTELEVAATQEPGQLAVAVAEVEDHRERVVLLRVGQQEVEQEALAAAGGAEDEGVADVADVEIEVVRRLVPGLEDRERMAPRWGLVGSPGSRVNRKLRSA